jgi:hypothetical protein
MLEDKEFGATASWNSLPVKVGAMRAAAPMPTRIYERAFMRVTDVMEGTAEGWEEDLRRGVFGVAWSDMFVD